MMSDKKYDISLEYCAAWNYLPRAVRAADELLGNYQHVINDMKLIPSGGGRFELVVDGDLVYSKKATGRHANDGEVLQIFEGIVGPDVPKYSD